MLNLGNKIAIVTGGASGIGLAITKNFLKSGAKVVVASWKKESEEVIKGLNNPNATFVKMDVSNEEEVKRLVEETVVKYGKLDIFVANAGIGDFAKLADETQDDWDRIVSVNLTGVFMCNKYAIKAMLTNPNGGSIINMSSVLGIVGDEIAPAYCACKAGIINLTKSGAAAYAKNRIRINAISPGYIHTPLIAGLDKAFMDNLVNKHPIGRLGEPEEVAVAANFLASSEASFITGITLPVDGGYTAV